MFSNLHKHDGLNFDEINQSSYHMISNESVNKSNAKKWTGSTTTKNSINEPVAYCIGSQCCDNGTEWDVEKLKCIRNK
jgi:hypothetical protein